MLVWSSLISSTVNSITWLASCCTSLFILSVVYLNFQWKVRNLWLDDLNMKWMQALACQLPSIKHGRRPSPHPPTWYPISFLPFTNTSTLFFHSKSYVCFQFDLSSCAWHCLILSSSSSVVHFQLHREMKTGPWMWQRLPVGLWFSRMPEHSGDKRLICTFIIPKSKNGILCIPTTLYLQSHQHIICLLHASSEGLNSHRIIIPVWF